MANETTFSIKFEGYEKTFNSINDVVEGLSDMKQELQQLEEEFSAAEFGSENWDQLNKNIKESEKNIKAFENQLSESSEISSKALQNTIKLQQESIKQSEEVAKKFDESFSPEAIIEFSAKAATAFIGLSEGFSGTGEAADKATERLNKALVKINGIKDTAEVAVSGIKKFNSTLDFFSDKLSKGGAAAQGLGKALRFLTTGLKGPFLLIGALTAALGGLISAFGSLANTINFVSDSLGGLFEGFKALLSFQNPLTAFNNEFERLGKIRGLEKQLETINNLQGEVDVLTAKYQRYIDQSLTFTGTQDLVNKQYEIQNKLLASQVAKLQEIADIETDLGKKQELRNEINAKKVQLVDLLSAKEQKLRELELSRIDSVLEKQKIADDSRALLIQKQLDLNSASTKIQVEGVTKLADLEINSVQRRIDALTKFGALDEAQTNELLALKVQVADLQIQKQKEIDNAIKNSGVVQRSILVEFDAQKIQSLEKQIEFENIISQKGIDNATKNILQIQEIKEAQINAELEKFDQIAQLSDEDKIRKQQLINEIAQLQIDSDKRILDINLQNIQLETNARNIQIDLREKSLEKQSEIQTAISNEELRLINLNIKQNEKRLNSFESFFNLGKIYKDIVKETNALYTEQQKIIDAEKQSQLDALQTEKDRLKISIDQLEAQKEKVDLLPNEILELKNLKEQLELLNGKEVKINLEFQTKTGENESNKAGDLKEISKQKVQAQIEEFQAIAQGLADVSSLVINAQLDALNAKLDQISVQKDKIDEQLSLLNSELSERQKEIDALTSKLSEAKGSEQSSLRQGLEDELALKDKILNQIKAEEAQKKALAKEEARIREQQAKATRLQTQIQSVLTLAQSIGAIAATAAASNVAAPVFIPLVIGAMAAGFAAVKSFVKFENGGRLIGPSHAEGGIKGTGRFSNIEVEGDEFIVKKKVARKYPRFLQAFNDELITPYAEGGFLPSDSLGVSSQIQQEIQQSQMIEAIKALDLSIAVTDISAGLDRVNQINVQSTL